MTTEVNKHERIAWLVKVCVAELQRGRPWPDVKKMAELHMITRWALGATARRDYHKIIEVEVQRQAGVELFQKQYQ